MASPDAERRDPETAARPVEEDGLPAGPSEESLAEPSEETPAGPSEESVVFERWSKLQILFVKDPGSAVTEADALIDEIVQARRKAFDAQRTSLTDRWQKADADTEDLRLVLQDYRKILGTLFPRQN
jgi:hypothetical protein